MIRSSGNCSETSKRANQQIRPRCRRIRNVSGCQERTLDAITYADATMHPRDNICKAYLTPNIPLSAKYNAWTPERRQNHPDVNTAQQSSMPGYLHPSCRSEKSSSMRVSSSPRWFFTVCHCDAGGETTRTSFIPANHPQLPEAAGVFVCVYVRVRVCVCECTWMHVKGP